MGDGRWSWVVVEVDEVVRETEKAILCVIDGEEHWFPTEEKYLHENSEVKEEGDSGDLITRLWLAEEKDVEYEPY